MNDQNDDKTHTHIVLAKGMMVSHYRIVEKIGAGGMGEVYLAEDIKLNRQVALKFMPVHLATDNDLRTRFTREAQAAAKLDHPNIIPIHEVGEHKGRPFIAMAHIEGESLRDVIKKGKLSISESVELAMQICDGLQKAHEAGVIHRDIKPGNIIIDNSGRARILDFGLATVAGDDKLTKTGSTLGTVGYLSPEMARGEVVDARSDLFSVGVILYELITGKQPFYHEYDAATINAILHETADPLKRYKSNIPDELQRIVSKLLEKDPSLRYQSAAGVNSDLKPLATQTRSSITDMPGKKKNIWPLAVGGLVIIATLIVAWVKYWPGNKTGQPVAPVDKRIMLAVLPFENLGAPDDEYFADGITDEITSRVGVLKGLGVIARTSVLQYKGTTKRIGEIGSELNVDYILEGTIRWDKSGDVEKVRITPQLIRVSDETHLWADNIQRDLSQIFEVQEEIAVSIAGALNLALITGDQKALDHQPTKNLEAYDYYLRASNYFNNGDFLKAIELLDKATDLDSNFALAFALKSQAHSQFAFGEMPASEHSKPARLAYTRAFEIQPDLAEAHLARGTYLGMIERDYSGALKEFEIARRGNVDKAQVLGAISFVKMRQGRWNEAIALDRQVIKLDPRSSRAGFITMQANWYIHRYDEALAATERLISLDPDGEQNFLHKAWIQVCMGEDVERIQETLSEWLRRATGFYYIWELEGLTFIKLLHLWNQSIDVDAKILAVKEELRRSPNPRPYFNAGLLYQSKGDKDSTYKYMNLAISVVNNRIAKARSDTTGRFEIFDLSHDVYDLLAMAYSLTNRHEQAIEHAQLAMDAMPVEACHW